MTLRPSPESFPAAPRMKEAPFGRVMTAMVTPFAENGRIDLRAAGKLAQYLVQTGSDGLVVAGTTGESPTITHEEQHELFWTVREAVDVPILAGTGSNDTKEAIELAEYATDNQLANGLLVVSPYYNRPPQSGIVDYFSQVADATDLPIVMYDIPVRTGRGIEHDTMVELARKFPHIRGLKDAAGDPTKTATLLRRSDLPSDFVVYSGDDEKNLALARVGSVGAISVASHWAAREMGAMYDAYSAGDVQMAESINAALQGSYDFETSADTPNPLPTKAMMRTILGGKAIGYCRSPLVIGSEAEHDLERRAREVRAELISLFGHAIDQ